MKKRKLPIQNILNKPLFQATIGDLLMGMRYWMQEERENENKGALEMAPPSKKRYVYGMAGLANLFGCSIPTAQRIKSSGVIDTAISQTAKTIVVDAELALDLLRLSNQKWGCKYPK